MDFALHASPIRIAFAADALDTAGVQKSGKRIQRSKFMLPSVPECESVEFDAEKARPRRGLLFERSNALSAFELAGLVDDFLERKKEALYWNDDLDNAEPRTGSVSCVSDASTLSESTATSVSLWSSESEDGDEDGDDSDDDAGKQRVGAEPGQHEAAQSKRKLRCHIEMTKYLRVMDVLSPVRAALKKRRSLLKPRSLRLVGLVNCGVSVTGWRKKNRPITSAGLKSSPLRT